MVDAGFKRDNPHEEVAIAERLIQWSFRMHRVLADSSNAEDLAANCLSREADLAN